MSSIDLQKDEVFIDGRTYQVQVRHSNDQPIQIPRLVVVAYQPNQLAQELLKVCINTLQRFTPEKHELWVIDNHSPIKNTEWLLRQTEISLILNHTEPIPPEKRNFWRRRWIFQNQQAWGSYANAIGLEIATRMINPQTNYIMTLHMDTMVCFTGWLTYLVTKLNDHIRISGVHLQRGRVPEGIVHILGNLFDFQLFKRLNLTFLPQLPKLDVGDRISIAMRQAGFGVFTCRNTFNEPGLVSLITPASPLSQLKVFRAFNDNNEVIFLHLGRGVRKTTGKHKQGVTPKEWIEFGKNILLS